MSFVEISGDESCQTWCIDRPDRLNAIGTSVARELCELAEQLSSTTRLLILRARPIARSGKRVWVAGGDLKELSTLDRDGAETYIRDMTQAAAHLAAANSMVLTVVEGAAIGGGAELALFGDVRLGSIDANLHFKQLDVGLATGYGAASRLVDLIGLAKSQGLLYGGRRVGADEALSLGLFHEVGGKDEIEKLVSTWRERILGHDPQSIAAQKQMFRQALDDENQQRVAAESAAFSSIWRNPKHAAFLARFVAGDS